MFKSQSPSSTLESVMLLTYLKNRHDNFENLYFMVIGKVFDIEIVENPVDPKWVAEPGIDNQDGTFRLFFSDDPRTPPANATEKEWINWFVSPRYKMLFEDLGMGRTYWVNWKNYIPWRPIKIEGWATNDIFVFSQFGNPWHGFLVAIDAKERKVLRSLQLEYSCN